MTPEKIKEVVSKYQADLTRTKVTPQRISETKKFGECSQEEILSHAAYLCVNILSFIENPEKFAKANRHLTAIQMCLSFANIYTLKEIMNHNRPD